MRWKRKKWKYGDLRIRKKFAFMPVQLNTDEMVWLETYWVLEKLEDDEYLDTYWCSLFKGSKKEDIDQKIYEKNRS